MKYDFCICGKKPPQIKFKKNEKKRKRNDDINNQKGIK